MGSDILAFGWRSGRLWLPIAAVLLAVTVALGFTAQAAVPTAVYTLF